MRVVADGAGDGDVVIVRERDGGILSVDQGEPGGTGMADAATPDVVGAGAHGLQHIRHDGGVFAGRPFLKRRRVGISGMAGAMAATANGGGDFNARPHGRVILAGGVVRRRAVAVFALHPGEQRCGRRAHEAGRQTVADGVARQAGGIGLSAQRHKRRADKGAGVRGVRLITTDAVMAGNADFGAGIFRSRAGDAEKRVAVKLGDGNRAGQVGGLAQRHPGRSQAVAFLEDLIIAGRPVPSELHAVGQLAVGHRDGARPGRQPLRREANAAWPAGIVAQDGHLARVGSEQFSILQVAVQPVRPGHRPETNARQGQNKPSH